MANITLHELLGISKERADEVARKVGTTFSDSETPGEWIRVLIEEFGIDRKNAEIFACEWFAGKYAGVSEVFNVVQKEMDVMEKDKAEKKEMESKYPFPDGYA